MTLDVSLFHFHMENLERVGWTEEDTIELLLFIQARLEGKHMIIGPSPALIWTIITAKEREDGLYAVVEKESVL